MFIHLLTPGGLPWTRNGIPKTDSAHDRIKRAKQYARPEELCKGMPSEFEDFLRYCRRLKFADHPDYDYWKDEFKALAEDWGFTDIERFIWPPPPAPKVKYLSVRPEFVLLIFFRLNPKSYGLLSHGRRLMQRRWRTSCRTWQNFSSVRPYQSLGTKLTFLTLRERRKSMPKNLLKSYPPVTTPMIADGNHMPYLFHPALPCDPRKPINCRDSDSQCLARQTILLLQSLCKSLHNSCSWARRHSPRRDSLSWMHYTNNSPTRRSSFSRSGLRDRVQIKRIMGRRNPHT